MKNKLIVTIKTFLPNSFRKPAGKIYHLIKFKLNYFSHLIILWKNKTFEFPVKIEIETTTICNRKCLYCPNSKYNRGKHFIDSKLFKKIIQQLASLKYCHTVSFHFYGEPLLDKRLPKLVRYTREKLPSAFLLINTNGDFLSRSLFNKLVSAGVSHFIITQYDYKMAKNIKLLLNSLDHKTLSEKITYRKFSNEVELFNRGGLINLPKKTIIKNCTLANSKTMGMVIDYQGNIILCCSDYFSSVKFGNLNDESLLEIWNKKDFKTIRKELHHGKFNLEICKKCRSN